MFEVKNECEKFSFFRRTYQDLASAILYPQGQRPVQWLQEGAHHRPRLGRSPKQFHRYLLPIILHKSTAVFKAKQVNCYIQKSLHIKSTLRSTLRSLY